MSVGLTYHSIPNNNNKSKYATLTRRLPQCHINLLKLQRITAFTDSTEGNAVPVAHDS